jgi:hypothetical protein
MHSKELIDTNVKEELEELINFGMEIEYSAWNLLNHKREVKEFAKRAKKNSGSGELAEEYVGSIDAFSKSLENVDQQLNIIRHTIVNGFDGILADF